MSRCSILWRLISKVTRMGNLGLANFRGQRLDGLFFCARVYDLFEQIRGSEGGASDLRMRRGKEKKRLIEELLPICKYVQARYRHGHYIDVTWVDGNQQFDARLDQRGGRSRKPESYSVAFLGTPFTVSSGPDSSPASSLAAAALFPPLRLPSSSPG